MKIRKIGLIIIILVVLYIPTWFIYTRFCINKYKMNGNKLTYKNYSYIRKDSLSDSDDEDLGKTIGIAIEDKRSIADYIWPYWIMEYKSDKEHNRILVRGLMDLGTVYERSSK